MDMINKTKSYLNTKFKMKDMSETSYVLGVKISTDSNMLYGDQENYRDKILKRFNMRNCKLVSRLVRKATIIHKKLCPTNKIEIKAMENVPYAQIVGSLMNLLTSTGPDISYAVRVVS